MGLWQFDVLCSTKKTLFRIEDLGLKPWAQNNLYKEHFVLSVEGKKTIYIEIAA